MADVPKLEDCGFIQVPSDQKGGLWMTCEQCKKSDHFWLSDSINCRCGARYGFALRPDGVEVPLDQLRFVPFKQGPMALADLEWDPRRLALMIGVALLVVTGVLYLIL